MKNKIQMTEEQANQLIMDMWHYEFLSIESSVEYLKKNGYIKKSDLEIAKEKYYDEYGLYFLKAHRIETETFNNYINELEKEIERLKKGE